MSKVCTFQCLPKESISSIVVSSDRRINHSCVDLRFVLWVGLIFHWKTNTNYNLANGRICEISSLQAIPQVWFEKNDIRLIWFVVFDSIWLHNFLCHRFWSRHNTQWIQLHCQRVDLLLDLCSFFVSEQRKKKVCSWKFESAVRNFYKNKSKSYSMNGWLDKLFLWKKFFWVSFFFKWRNHPSGKFIVGMM